jgi:hypothetical protein
LELERFEPSPLPTARRLPSAEKAMVLGMVQSVATVPMSRPLEVSTIVSVRLLPRELEQRGPI